MPDRSRAKAAAAAAAASLLLPLVARADTLSTVTIYAIDPAASEAGPKAATIMIARNDGDLTKPLVVPLQVAGTATAGVDYASPGASITFPANVPLVTLRIMPTRDALAEGEETVTLTLGANPAAYQLGEERSATMTIADASGAGGAGSAAAAAGARSLLPPPDRTGTLTVTISFDGAGTWKHAKNGAYSNLRFHRELSYTIELRGTYSAGSGDAQLDRRDAQSAVTPDFRRYLVGQPRDKLGPAGTACGKGTIAIRDESSGMEVGDPGQPPLVPFTQQIKGGGAYPSGDRTVPERDLCQTQVIFDNQRHVLHLTLDGTDSYVKVTNVHNGHAMPPYNLRLQGDAADAKAQFTLRDLPVPVGASSAEGSKVLANVSTIGGPDHAVFALTATVKWRVQM